MCFYIIGEENFIFTSYVYHKDSNVSRVIPGKQGGFYLRLLLGIWHEACMD